MEKRHTWVRKRLALVIALVGALALMASHGFLTAGAQGLDPDAQLYLDQVQPILADAAGNLNDLSYYLPVASVNDVNDPTWGLAQQASDALRDDAGALETLSPPDTLSVANQELIRALSNASSSADAAIAALSTGDTSAGQGAMSAFSDADSDFMQAQRALPQETPLLSSG
jgi:hypothetical protein